MKTCSNIVELDLYASVFGCSNFPRRYNLPFNLDGSDRYLSSLRVLKLEAYDFDGRDWEGIQRHCPIWSNKDGAWPLDRPSWESWVYNVLWDIDYTCFRLIGSWWVTSGNALRWYNASKLSPEKRTKTNLELWLEAMDFSQIHTLAIKETHHPTIKGDALFNHLPAALPSLRSLTVGGPWTDFGAATLPKTPPARDFILAFPPSSLTNLTWLDNSSCDEEIFNKVLQHHGQTLKQLEWRNSELRYKLRPILSIDQIQQLGALAPDLQDLTIDLNREGSDSWPHAKLDALATSLPKLTSLTIYFELATECGRKRLNDEYTGAYTGPKYFVQPLLETSSAREMFKRLRAAKVGEELTTVRFRAGDWTRSYHGGLRDGPSWLEGRRVDIKCTVFNEDGTRKEEEVWCRAVMPRYSQEVGRRASYYRRNAQELQDYDSMDE
ncbi:hypothetical protein QQX98_004325 [Neonectria punicea]|uniref:Uncharacterized protein n=1 Tax=Neonectria punicea TaxID=979145 RepID=A0ABR1H9P5_9HYPO